MKITHWQVRAYGVRDDGTVGVMTQKEYDNMTRQIALKGFRLDKHGKLVRDQRRLDVCTRLKQASSKRVRVVRKGTA